MLNLLASSGNSTRCSRDVTQLYIPEGVYADCYNCDYFISPSIFPVYLRCMGGELGAASSLQPKVAPLGLVGTQFVMEKLIDL